MLRNEVPSLTNSHTWEGVVHPSHYGRRRQDPQRSADVYQTGNALLSSIPEASLRGLTPHLRRVDFAREEYLFQQDDHLEYVYFPETAVVSELHLLDDGRMVEVAVSGRYDAIGIGSLYDAGHISNCVQTTQAGTLVRIESTLLKKQCVVDPKLPSLLHASLERYIRQISQRAVCNMYHSIEQRLCSWLLLLHEFAQRSSLRLTHEQIARALGVYRPSITCIALELRNSGLIDYKRGVISILDKDGLSSTACGCYHELLPEQIGK